MTAPQLHLRSGRSSSTQPSQTATSTRIEVAGTLRLRGVSTEDRRIRWAEDVVDNEGMGRKSSKVCCIYHAPRAVGESSSESSSDSSSSDGDNDSEPDNSTARIGGKRRKRRQDEQDHDHDHDHDHTSAERIGYEKCSKADEGADKGTDVKAKVRAKGKGKGSRRKRSPNAYEKMPKVSGTQTMVQEP